MIYQWLTCYSTLHPEVVTAAVRRGPSTSRRSNGSCQWTVTAETPWLHCRKWRKIGTGKHPERFCFVGIIICLGITIFKKHRNVRNIRSFHCFVSLAKNQKEPSEMSAGCVARLLQRSGENMLRVLTTVFFSFSLWHSAAGGWLLMRSGTESGLHW